MSNIFYYNGNPSDKNTPEDKQCTGAAVFLLTAWLHLTLQMIRVSHEKERKYFFLMFNSFSPDFSMEIKLGGKRPLIQVVIVKLE